MLVCIVWGQLYDVTWDHMVSLCFLAEGSRVRVVLYTQPVYGGRQRFWLPLLVFAVAGGGVMAVDDPRHSREFQMLKQSSSDVAEEEGTRGARGMLFHCSKSPV